jgi:hypothetical protein
LQEELGCVDAPDEGGGRGGRVDVGEHGRNGGLGFFPGGSVATVV